MIIQQVLSDLVYEGFIDRKRIVYRYYRGCSDYDIAYRRAKRLINYMSASCYIRVAYPLQYFLLTASGHAKSHSMAEAGRRTSMDQVLQEIPEHKLEHSLLTNDARWWMKNYCPQILWATEHFAQTKEQIEDSFIPDFAGFDSRSRLVCIGEIIRTNSSRKVLNGKLRVYNQLHPEVPRIWVCDSAGRSKACKQLLDDYPGPVLTRVVTYTGITGKTLFCPEAGELLEWKEAGFWLKGLYSTGMNRLTSTSASLKHWTTIGAAGS